MVELPLQVAWSGRVFDLDRPRRRMSLYRTVLAGGMRDDLCRILNHDMLLELWPTLYRLIGLAVREAWEDAFPEFLASRTSVQRW
ncbi:transcriptional regulator [Streptomyces sp. NBC_01314]|uniref:transcriptional regulator n=1 Tax=Streptomyces sp. NBC_01314 TaxID=2903821 RepID=UPI003090199B|nr:transcriptional regulator [Streptomyces sp. NBC_01314]